MAMYISYYWSVLVVMLILYAGIYSAARTLQVGADWLPFQPINVEIGIYLTNHSRYLDLFDQSTERSELI